MSNEIKAIKGIISLTLTAGVMCQSMLAHQQLQRNMLSDIGYKYFGRQSMRTAMCITVLSGMIITGTSQATILTELTICGMITLTR